jgi:hypothetical protein
MTAAVHRNGDFRFGSNSEVRARNWAVRFTLKNRRRQPGLSGPKTFTTPDIPGAAVVASGRDAKPDVPSHLSPTEPHGRSATLTYYIRWQE